MEMMGSIEILAKGGRRMNIPRNMSSYNGKMFDCACGSQHVFSSYMDRRNFVSSRLNAKMLITCPEDSSFATLVKAKHKCLFIFSEFVSIAGYHE